MKRLLTGLEAFARAAAEEGAVLVSGHAVPPVTALLDAALREGVRPVRAPSEKAAVEIALGASLAGGRAVATVTDLAGAADPLHAMAYVGSAGGLAVVALDDPGLSLRAVEADSRTMAQALELPWLEPSDPAECKAHLAAALALSEAWETPVVVRLTTRLALTGRPVAIGPTGAGVAAGMRWDRERRVLSPEHGRKLRLRVKERLAQLAAHAAESPLNRMELRSTELGVITAGAAYHHLREAFPDASVLKLGFPYPFPTDLAREFAARVERLVVVEELEPVLEAQTRAAGIACQGKDLLPRAGELAPDLLVRSLGGYASRPARDAAPERPPEASPGCPQRALLHALKRLHVSVAGDPGCAAVGFSAPVGGADSAVAPGAAIAVAHGVDVALGSRVRGRQVALLCAGDFLDSGALALTGAAAHGGTVLVVDDAHASAGEPVVDLVSLARALGASRVREVDPLDLAATQAVLREELARSELSVVIARGRCPARATGSRTPLAVHAVRCNRCGACLRLGCPAISDAFEAMAIDAAACAGCGLCAQVCRAGAIGAAAAAHGRSPECAEQVATGGQP